MPLRKMVIWFLALNLILLCSGNSLAAKTLTVAIRTNIAEKAWMDWAKAEYESTHPDIKIEITQPGGGNNFKEKLTVLRAGGVFPDIFHGTSAKRDYITDGWVLDLTPYFQRDKAEIKVDDFIPTLLNCWMINGKLYALPMFTSGFAMYYNVDALANAGLKALPANWSDTEWTWDKMVQYGKKLTKSDSEGRVINFGVRLVGDGVDANIQHLFGGDNLSAKSYLTGIPESAAIYSPENTAAFTAVVDVYNNFRIAPGTAAPAGGATFANGRIAIDWGGGSVLRDYATTDLGFKVGLAVPPKVRDRAPQIYNEPLFINSETKYPEEAWAFLKFLTGRVALTKRVEFTGVLSARRTTMQGYLETYEPKLNVAGSNLAGFFTGQMENGWYGEERVAYWGQINRFAAPLLRQIVSGQQAIAAGLQTAHDQVNNYIAELLKK